MEEVVRFSRHQDEMYDFLVGATEHQRVLWVPFSVLRELCVILDTTPKNNPQYFYQNFGVLLANSGTFLVRRRTLLLTLGSITAESLDDLKALRGSQALICHDRSA